jgi:4-amino-4-deoxy-L-arabinose transferase-like glycosyltransferase
MKDKTTSRRWLIDYTLLLFTLSLYGINMYHLTGLDSEPPKWDEAVHLRDSLVFYNILTNPSQINLEIIKDIMNKSERYPLLRPSGYYPPLVAVLTSPLYSIFGTSQRVATMSNTVFLPILVFSTYEIGTLVFNRNTGLLASFIILLSPIVLEHSVIYYLDLPLTAMVALCVFIILRSDYFRNRTLSIISGLSFGLGMLTKWTLLFFVLGPIVCSALTAFNLEGTKEKDPKEPFYLRKTLMNMALFTFTSIATFGPYYLPILPDLIGETMRFSQGALAHGPDSPFSFDSASFYPVALWRDMITPFGFIVFTIGSVMLVFSRNRYKTFLLVWTIVPYIIFTFVIQNKQPRYMMPWLVPISLIISFCVIGIATIRVSDGSIRPNRYAISIFSILFALFFFREDLRLRDSILGSSRGNWQINEMVSVLERDMKEGAHDSTRIPMYLGVIPDHQYINGQTIRYYAALRGLSLNVIKLENYKGTALKEFVERFGIYDYILTKNPSNIVITPFQKSVDDMNGFFYSHIDRFKLLKTFYEPDGSEVSIFKRKGNNLGPN